MEAGILLRTRHRPISLDSQHVVTPPSMGPRHVPIHHYDLVLGIEAACARNNLTITGMDMTIGGSREWEGERHYDVEFCGMLSIKNGHSTEEMGTTLGFWGCNGMRKALHIVCGRNTFVCGNGSIIGDAILIHRKHTKGFDLNQHLGEAIQRFVASQEDATVTINRMKGASPTPQRIKEFLYNVWSKRIVPSAVVRDVHDLYYRTAVTAPETVPDIAEYRGSAWGVHAAFTRALRDCPLDKRLKHTTAIDTPFRFLTNPGYRLS